MRVDTALALRVLAHELRSPAGVAQGYVRMLLEGRLTEPADQRRALEQIREVLGRIGQLSRQASEVATWLERDDSAVTKVDARVLLEGSLASIRKRIDVDAQLDLDRDVATVTSLDQGALSSAIAAIVEAVARERPGQTTRLGARICRTSQQLEILAGIDEVLAPLAAGPCGLQASPLVVERGGVGLTLVSASMVLASHGATTWSVDNQRGACGIRIPVECIGENMNGPFHTKGPENRP
jgi:hypothetical protein